MKKIIYSVGFLFVVLVAVSCMRDSAKAVPELQEIVFLVEDATPDTGADGGLSVETKAMPEPRREPLVLRPQEDSVGRNGPDTSKMVMKDSTGLLEASVTMSSVPPPKKSPRRFHMEAKASLSTETARMDFPDLHDGTKADVTSLSTFNLVCMTGSAGSESQVWALSGTTGSTGKYWPDSNPSYRFAASNAPITFNAAGCTVAATNATDVVVSYLASPAYKTTNTLQFKHVFGQIADVTVSPSSGFTASDITGVSISIVPKTGGTYNIRTDAWSDVTTGTATSIANSTPGTKSNALMLVPGKYAVSVAWNAKGSAKTDELEVTVTAGEKLNLEIALGGSSDFVEVSDVWVQHALSACVINKGYNFDFSQSVPIDGEIVLRFSLLRKYGQKGPATRLYLANRTDSRTDGDIAWKYYPICNISINQHAYYNDNIDQYFGVSYLNSGTEYYQNKSTRGSKYSDYYGDYVLTVNQSDYTPAGYLGSLGSPSGVSGFVFSNFWSSNPSKVIKPVLTFQMLSNDPPRSGYDPTTMQSLRIRSASVSVGGVTYLDLVPVRQVSTSTYGLYDRISKTFCSSVTAHTDSSTLTFLGE